MHFLTLCLCVVIVTTQAQFLGTNLLQQIPGVNSLPLLNSLTGQQFLQGLQSLSSFQQVHGSGSPQGLKGPRQQNYGSQLNLNNGPPGRPGVGGQKGGLQQSGFGVSQQSGFDGSLQTNERPGFNGHPPPPPPRPFGGQQQRPGFGNNQQQEQGFNRPPPPQQQIGSLQQQRNFVQQSGYGGAQSQGYTESVQDYSYNFEQNNQGIHPSSSNYENIYSNEDQDQIRDQQYKNFYHFGNSDDQDDDHHHDTDNNQNEYQYYDTFYQFGNTYKQEDLNYHEEYEEHEEDGLLLK